MSPWIVEKYKGSPHKSPKSQIILFCIKHHDTTSCGPSVPHCSSNGSDIQSHWGVRCTRAVLTLRHNDSSSADCSPLSFDHLAGHWTVDRWQGMLAACNAEQAVCVRASVTVGAEHKSVDVRCERWSGLRWLRCTVWSHNVYVICTRDLCSHNIFCTQNRCKVRQCRCEKCERRSGLRWPRRRVGSHVLVQCALCT